MMASTVALQRIEPGSTDIKGYWLIRLRQRRDKRATIFKRPGKNTGASGNVLGALPRSMAYKPCWGNPKTSINLEKTTDMSCLEGQSINDSKVVLIFVHNSGRNAQS